MKIWDESIITIRRFVLKCRYVRWGERETDGQGGRVGGGRKGGTKEERKEDEIM